MNKPDEPNDTTAASDMKDKTGDAASGVSATQAATAIEASTLGKMLRDGALRHYAPQSLRERLRDELAHAERHASFATGAITSPSASPPLEAKPDVRPPKAGTPVKHPEAAWGLSLAPWLFGGAGGAILGGLAVAMALLVARPPAPPQDPQATTGLQPQEIVASHVRALLSQHPIDVISTDQHTVKPWFNGRIDYAPSVVDLSAKGFPLEGGRLDYVGGRTVAVLVYRTDKHPIDLYVFPARDKGAAAPTITGADGYAIARWRRGGMTYWAITDAEVSHLRVFVEAVQAAT
ncbi:transmembrane transcriptional regulator (anti-sigma factor) [Pandoraea horticolens]|uniref:Transmembrane transcriptional regulator (Anti-sigma factor) n=1 Tax=Pandoraea horticolens TaxID=2508298 RepID=A0A5E4X7F5_9BURK|nr:anti-sigma factor [Pandoraea horticolens]VVE32321.1 transmembrane transcriptional regulator (anti-sigma factor) [Pandoraea horticolens]